MSEGSKVEIISFMSPIMLNSNSGLIGDMLATLISAGTARLLCIVCGTVVGTFEDDATTETFGGAEVFCCFLGMGTATDLGT